MRYRLVTLTAIFGLLAGCASGRVHSPAEQNMRDKANDFPVCATETECNAMWQRATKWLQRRSYWPIKTMTEELIETDRPRWRMYSRTWYRVIKRPARAGGTLIEVHASCLPSVYCHPDVDLARGSFNHFVKTSEEVDIAW